MTLSSLLKRPTAMFSVKPADIGITLTVLGLLQFGTIRTVAEYLRVGWDLVKEIHKTWLAMKYRAINLSEAHYLGIDEFSLKKRHTDMAIFVDLQSGRIINAVEGTSKEAIAPFLKIVAKKAKSSSWWSWT